MNFSTRKATDRRYSPDDAPLHSIKDIRDLCKAAIKELSLGSKLYVNAWGGEYADSFFLMELVRRVDDGHECIWLDADGRMILDYDGNVMFTSLRGTCTVYVDALGLPLDDVISSLGDTQGASNDLGASDDSRSMHTGSPIPLGFPKIPATNPTRENKYHKPLVSKQPVWRDLGANSQANAGQPV